MPDAKMILIVEDVIDVAELMRLSLEAIGLSAYHTYNAEQAVRFIEQQRPDLIILDIGLPEVSGWSLLHFINDWRKSVGVKVLVASAYADPANRLIGKLQEVDGYLKKPFEIAELQSMVLRLLASTDAHA